MLMTDAERAQAQYELQEALARRKADGELPKGPECVEIVNFPDPVDLRDELKAATAAIADLAKTVSAGNKLSAQFSDAVTKAIGGLCDVMAKNAPQAMDMSGVVDALKANTTAQQGTAKKLDGIIKSLSAEREILFDQFDNPIGVRPIQ